MTAYYSTLSIETHSPAAEHLCWFHILTAVNSDDMKMHTHVLEYMFSILLGINLQVMW